MKATGMSIAVALAMAAIRADAQPGLRFRPNFSTGTTASTQFNGREVRSQISSFLNRPTVNGFGGQNGQNRGDNRQGFRNRRDRNQSDNSGGGAYYPDSYYYVGGYNNNYGGYIGPKRYDQPNAYTAGRFGYAGPNGYSAPDGYAGPYGYPFDNAVWWDARFHHPYRGR